MRLFGLEFSLKRVSEMRHQRIGTIGHWLLPRTKFDYANQVGDGLGSSTVVAPVLWVARNFPEAPILVERYKGQELETVPNHKMVNLIRRPNAHYSGRLLWMATMISYQIDGNAYWVKARANNGGVTELWYVPHWLIQPKIERDSTGYIDYYEYRPGGPDVVKLDPGDVVHFRFGLDPRNTRKGLSPLASLLREIFTDDEAAAFTASILKNLGVPGILVAPKEAGTISPDEMIETKEALKNKFTGDKRGEPLVLSGPTELVQFGFNPQQMDLKTLRRIPEERVTAVFGVPAVVCGLGAGLDRSTFANFYEAREAAYESNIIPTQNIIADELHVQLLRDFESQLDQFQVRFDNSKVRVLQEDENKAAIRYGTLYKNGLIRRAEARTRLGFEATPEDDIYFEPKAPPADVLAGPGKRARILDVETKAANNESEWKKFDKVRRAQEEKLAKKIAAQFNREADRLGLSDLRADPESILAMIDEGAAEWSDLLSGSYVDIATVFAQRQAAKLGLGALDVVDYQALAEKWASKVALERVRDITDTTKELLRDAITRGIENGDSIPDIAQSLLDMYDQWAGRGDSGIDATRAMRIARTETGMAANRGANEGAGMIAEDAGLQLESIWLATADDRTRETHAAIDGERVPYGEPFSNGLLYPGDPSGPPEETVNCRCAIAHQVVGQGGA